MDAKALALRLEERFASSLEATVRSPKRLYVRVWPPKLRAVVAWLKENVEGLRLGTSTGIDLRESVGVFHHFCVNGTPLVITVKVHAEKPDLEVPSLAGTISAASWIEREIHEFLGVEFTGHPDPRRLLKSRAFPEDAYPLRRDFDVRELKEGGHGS